MIAVVVTVVVLAALVVAAVVLVGLRRRREERWHNAELFVPHSSPVGPGGRVVLRYRRQFAGHDAAAATVEAELRCEEHDLVAGRSEVVWSAPLDVVTYSTGDVVEADVVAAVPLAAPAPSVETSIGAIRWTVAVAVTATDGTRVAAAQPLPVSSAVAP